MTNQNNTQTKEREMTNQNRKRQSTTAKITKATIILMEEYCRRTGDGVILRFRGVEHGVSFGTLYPTVSCYRGWTIRKTTVESMESDLLIMDCKQALGIA